MSSMQPCILIDEFPIAVEIDGQEYPIESDFRTCLQVIMAFEDPELTWLEKQVVLLNNLYPEKPQNLEKALELGLKFLNGSHDTEPDDGPAYRLYSFAQDANFIFAAFRQTHGIDLETTQMHWWKFMALFMDLGENTTFCQLVSLRKRVKSGKATKEERRMAREMGGVFDLPEIDTRSLEEKEREALFMRLVEEGQKKREQTQT